MYKKSSIYLMLFSVLILGLPLICEASFETLAFNARSSGLSDSFTAVADDANTIIFNPAGLGQIKRIQVSTQYTRLFSGLSDGSKIADNAFSYLQPLGKIGTLGIGYFSRSLSSLYKEQLIIFGYGREITPDSYIGLNLKYASLSTSISSTALTRSKVSQPSLDLGFLYNSYDQFLLGLSISDLNQPNLNMTSNNNKIPLTIRAGINYVVNEQGTFIVASDFTQKNKENKVSLGAENWIFPKFMALRAGFVTGVSNKDLLNLSMGFSIKLKDILYFDYAFMYPLKGIKNTNSYRASLSAKFGKEEEKIKTKRGTKNKEKKDSFEEFREKWFK